MKSCLVLVAAALVSAAPAAFSQDSSKTLLPFQHAKPEQTEASLKKALESNVPGMQISAALTIREMKSMMPKKDFESLVIPLMAVLKNDKADESARVLAAMALHDLHSPKGDYAISKAADDANSPGLQKTCQWLTYYSLHQQKPEYATQEN